jgi:WD40 repeat protein
MLNVPGFSAELTGVAFNRDGRRFAAGCLDGSVILGDAHSGEKIFTFQGKAGPVHGVALNPVTGALASAHHDGTVKVWDSEHGGAGRANPWILSFPAHTDAVFGVTYSPDGRLLATAGGRDQEHNIGIWQAATGKAIRGLRQEHFVRSVAFSPDSRRLACTSGRKVALWDVTTGQELDSISFADHLQFLRVAFSPDGRRLAMACEGQTVRLWDPGKGEELVPLHVSGGELWGVAFSPDGRYLATCSGYKDKGTLQIWNAGLWDK